MKIGKRIGEALRGITVNRAAREAGELGDEIAGPDAFGVRQGWNASEVAPLLDPARLAGLIRGAKAGDMQDYLTLAEEMEERDPHYRSVLGTRKLSIVGLEAVVKPAGESAGESELADNVRRDIVERPEFRELVTNALDALGKGFSVNEIMWDTSGTPWRPTNYLWRDPRWFDYDDVSGRQILLREGAQRVELPPHKFVIHQPLLKSGLPIRGGMALASAYYYLIKAFDVAGWAAFVEVFGYPIRLGKYGRNANKNDIDVLKRAVRNIGRDIGAVIPDAMAIEIVEGVKTTGATSHFERLAKWVDAQISKAILGQTASTEGTPGKLGSEEAQQEVRLDIKEADARQLETTLNRDLIIPYIDLNYGIQERYPTLHIPVPRPEDVNGLVENVAKLVPLGFRVKLAELYTKLGLTEPNEDDAVLEAPAANEPPASDARNTRLGSEVTSEGTQRNAERDPDDLELIEEERDWEPILTPIRDALRTSLDECQSFEEFQQRIGELMQRMDTEELTRALAVDMFKARGLGDGEFESDE